MSSVLKRLMVLTRPPVGLLVVHTLLVGLLAAAAWAGSEAGVLVGVVIASVLEGWVRSRPGEGDAGVGPVLSHLAPLRAVVVLAIGATAWPDGTVVTVAVAAAVVTTVAVVTDTADARLEGLRRHPASRGVPGVGSVPPLRRPSPWLVPVLPELCLYVPALLWPDRPVAVAAGVAAGVVVALTVAARWGRAAWRARSSRVAVLAGMRRFLRAERPTVVLYGGDGREAVHEVAVWLPTLERLPCSAVVLLRNRAALAALPPTRVPALCVPGTTDLLSLPLGETRVALFPSNIGNNIHVLRVPGVRSAFIGHGDSDKSASANPYAKVYDEVWVAGPAGRERYLRAAVGLRPDALVEVGRPQVDLVRQAPAQAPGVPTLLYAPTWEGWNRDQDYSSVATHGVALVRAVLQHPQPIRLLYRPHPYTGRRDPAAAAAHREIVALLQDANATAGVEGATVLEPEAPAQPDATRSAADVEAEAVARGEERVRLLPESAHVVVTPAALPLVSCFNVADGLVTDVSSVLSDFLVSDKPVGVCATSGQDPDDFVAAFPSTRAAMILTPSPRDVTGLIDVVTGRRPDTTAERRRSVRRELLGPPGPAAIVRFGDAVTALAGRAHGGVPAVATADS
ncbi:hypothetical protein [Geodermatophilus sp. SYSU D01105]